MDSICCKAKLKLRTDSEYAWSECSSCGRIQNKMTKKELVDKIKDFISEPDEEDRVIPSLSKSRVLRVRIY